MSVLYLCAYKDVFLFVWLTESHFIDFDSPFHTPAPALILTFHPHPHTLLILFFSSASASAAAASAAAAIYFFVDDDYMLPPPPLFFFHTSILTLLRIKSIS